MAKTKEENIEEIKDVKKTEFFCYFGEQYTDADIIINAGNPKLNPATWKLELDDATIEKVKFERWVYVTEVPYEIEFLSMYNSWGKLSNGKILNPTPFPIISTKRPNQVEAQVIEKTITVEKKVIPANILDMLEEAVIADYAKNEFSYEIKSEKKKDMIEELIKEWFCSK